MPAVRERELVNRATGEASEMIRARVVAAHERQLARFRGTGIFANSHMGPREVRQHCAVDEAGEALMVAAVRRLGLSARAYHRVLRLARTIADLAGSDRIDTQHIAESIQYRAWDRIAPRSRW